MATDIGLLDGGSPDDPIDAKYGVVDTLETGEKSLKSSTLETFNKKVRSLAAGILIADDGENVKDLPAYHGAFTDDDGDVGLSLVQTFDSAIIVSSERIHLRVTTAWWGC